jgi:hypothetical protein
MQTPQERLREILAKVNPKAAQLFDEHMERHAAALALALTPPPPPEEP